MAYPMFVNEANKGRNRGKNAGSEKRLTCQRWINVTEVESMSEAERERKNCMQTVKAEAKTRSNQLRENCR